MSDNNDPQAKQFDPTPRRIAQAREEGQVAKSREVPTAAVVLASGIGLMVVGGPLITGIREGMQIVFSRSYLAAGDVSTIPRTVGPVIWPIMTSLLGFFALVAFAGLFGHVAQTGILIAPKALAPKMERINPFKRLKELFGAGPASIRVLVALLKATFIGLVVWNVASDRIGAITQTSTHGALPFLAALGDAVITVFVSAGIAFLIPAGIDFAWQRHRHHKQLKMTREEITREQKEDGGSPELKNKRRAMHRELSLNRIMLEVPTADVIVTNPTHYAVALRYVAGQDSAPRVVAKGTDHLALTIRRVARQNGVPIMESRRLARALHREVKVGRAVPESLFQAVAEVLAWVYGLKQGGA